MQLPRRHFLHLATGAAAIPAVTRLAWAQDYPTRPVRFILPVVAGGSTDVVARLVGEHLSRVFGQQFIVDNRSGAGGTAGLEAVAKSAPDGYTILVTSDRVASAQHAFKLNFDPIKDLAPISQLTRQPLVLAVHHSLGIGSLADLLARARAAPGARAGRHQRRRGHATVSERR
jgi:tripartite-type tricarboxylate transporter receptor subunit TctC